MGTRDGRTGPLAMVIARGWASSGPGRDLRARVFVRKRSPLRSVLAPYRRGVGVTERHRRLLSDRNEGLALGLARAG